MSLEHSHIGDTILSLTLESWLLPTRFLLVTQLAPEYLGQQSTLFFYRRMDGESQDV